MVIREVNQHRAKLDHISAHTMTTGNTRKVADEPQLIINDVHMVSTKSKLQDEMCML